MCRDLPYLLTASEAALQAFELSRLSHVSDLRRQLRATVEEMVSEMVAAEVARMLLEQRGRSKRRGLLKKG